MGFCFGFAYIQTRIFRPGSLTLAFMQAEYSRALTQPAQDIRFHITVQLPVRGGLKEYKDLSTDLPLFSHELDDFTDVWGGALFEVVRFKSSNAPIDHGVCHPLSSVTSMSICAFRAFLPIRRSYKPAMPKFKVSSLDLTSIACKRATRP
jgi:hypothetical protein